MNFEELRKSCEELIRSGRRRDAQELLAAIKGKPIPRSRAAEIANLARRCGLLQLALRIMSPIIRPKVALDQEATPEERAAYSLILLGLGASIEALELLESTVSRTSEVDLATAFTHINRWDYAKAIPYLETYLESSAVSPYQAMIARVNLAASLVAIGKAESARPQIEQIIEETKANSWTLLHKNALELAAQIAIQQSDWSRAESLLGDAAHGTSGDTGLDDLFIRKWQAIAAFLKDGGTDGSLERVLKIRAEAVASHHWETVRDCDYHRALVRRESNLVKHVYFGTPYGPFRARIEESTQGWMSIDDHYVWQLDAKQGSARIFCVHAGEEIGGGAQLKPGKALYNALRTMSSDFYRPFLIGTIHAAVFPGEHFNPVSSPRRVSFLIQRLREWLRENQIPLAVRVSPAGYSIEASGPYAFRLRKHEEESVRTADPAHYLRMIEKLMARWGKDPFTASDAASHLGISIRSARYLTQWALETKRLLRTGSGRATQYRIAG